MPARRNCFLLVHVVTMVDVSLINVCMVPIYAMYLRTPTQMYISVQHYRNLTIQCVRYNVTYVSYLSRPVCKVCDIWSVYVRV